MEYNIEQSSFGFALYCNGKYLATYASREECQGKIQELQSLGKQKPAASKEEKQKKYGSELIELLLVALALLVFLVVPEILLQPNDFANRSLFVIIGFIAIVVIVRWGKNK